MMATPRVRATRDHWWPMCVSEHWVNEDGGINWLKPDGEVIPLTPINTGVIGNGHAIKLGRTAEEETVWDQSFEKVFERADTNFPGVIKRLNGLERLSRLTDPIAERFLPQNASDDQISLLVEGLVSLAVRSPMFREAAVGPAEMLMGPRPARERNQLIALNMRHCQRMIADNIGVRGKFAVIYSPDREFIFGDGFFHNISSPANAPMSPQILAPLTPEISVLYARPMEYSTEPRLVTLVVSAEEAEALNNAVQVYAGGALFYRSERPALTEAFRGGRHLRYGHPDNPIDNFIRQLPGVPPRNRSLDGLFADMRTTT